MMDFAPQPRKPVRESVVPMINVVFLLLIFFLMSAQIAPPDPVEVELPVVELLDDPVAEGVRTVWLGRDGELQVEDASGDMALARLADIPGAVALHADAGLSAAVFAHVLRQMAEAGITDVTLVAIAGAE
ncbi:MAG: ExbD/TolR family protein [Roseinatronobacter sp.]